MNNINEALLEFPSSLTGYCKDILCDEEIYDENYIIKKPKFNNDELSQIACKQRKLDEAQLNSIRAFGYYVLILYFYIFSSFVLLVNLKSTQYNTLAIFINGVYRVLYKQEVKLLLNFSRKLYRLPGMFLLIALNIFYIQITSASLTVSQ
jgi:hypothetical protein